MDSAARTQIRLLLENAVDLTRKAIQDRLKALYADHAARGLLRSGGTIKIGVRTLEEEASSFITGIVDLVSPVVKDVEAFAMMSEATEILLSSFDAELDGIVSMVTGRMKPNVGESVDQAGRTLLHEAILRLRRQLELHRFTFTQPSQPLAMPAVVWPAPDVAKNRGGKPLAAHWDDMWASIAIQLYTGDLQPKTQADVERAMQGWFVDSDLEIGDTALRDRARKLWQKYEAAR